MSKSQNRGKCIYCGGFHLTKEHIWADWLRAYVPRSFTKNRHNTRLGGFKEGRPNFFVDAARGRLDGPGDPHSRKLRIVCKECNNGWSSDLQLKTKPLLSLLAVGKIFTATGEYLSILSAWIASFVMVAEYADPPTIAISQKERAFLKDNQKAPPSFHIWVAFHNGNSKMLGYFNHLGFNAKTPFMVSDEWPPKPNFFPSQSTAFTVGKLFVLCFSSETQSLPDWSFNISLYPLMKIWPPSDNQVLTTLPLISNDEIKEVSKIFIHPTFRSTVKSAL